MIEAIFQALDAALDGRSDKFWLWIVAAYLLGASAFLVETYKVRGGK